jgi:hypothetical protein
MIDRSDEGIVPRPTRERTGKLATDLMGWNSLGKHSRFIENRNAELKRYSWHSTPGVIMVDPSRRECRHGKEVERARLLGVTVGWAPSAGRRRHRVHSIHKNPAQVPVLILGTFTGTNHDRATVFTVTAREDSDSGTVTESQVFKCQSSQAGFLVLVGMNSWFRL